MKIRNMFFRKQLSCNVPGGSVTTLLPGGSCWGLVTVEEIVGGYLNAFSCWENVFRGRQWSLAGLDRGGRSGLQRCYYGSYQAARKWSKEKKARKNPSTILCCGFSSVTAIGNYYFENVFWKVKTVARTVFLKGCMFFLWSLAVDLLEFKKVKNGC